MQFLAIMKGKPSTPREKMVPLAKQETLEAWAMTKADVMRSLWYIPGAEGPAGTVALLECTDQLEAEARCKALPFVVNGVVSLEIIPLGPCTAYEMLFGQEQATDQ